MAAQKAAVQVETSCFDKAAALDASGKTDEASAAYLAILHEQPDHAGALNNFGALLCRTGHRSAARTAFAQAARCHPRAPAGHVNLANLLREDGESESACAHYEAALASDPACAEAHQGLAYIWAERGEPARADRHRRLGWQDRVFTEWRYRGSGTPPRVLLLTSVLGGNIPVRAILDDRLFAVTAVALEFLRPDMALPPHDAVFNAAGDADLCGDALRAAERLVPTVPVINPAGAVRRTARLDNAVRLATGPGVRTPCMALLSRDALQAGAVPDSAFPLLLRAPGFHTGQHFALAATAAEAAEVAASMPAADLLAIEFLAATGKDGMVRKFRVMAIGGQLYPLHLAISPDWKVHYFTAAMAGQAAFRAEEAAFLADMPGVLGDRAMAALRWIAQTLALDYAGMDFALDGNGRVLVFEANATMALVPPPPEPIWDYRRPAYDAALAASQRLVHEAAGQPRG